MNNDLIDYFDLTQKVGYEVYGFYFMNKSLKMVDTLQCFVSVI